MPTTVDKVVLMRPTSVTHHADYDQRDVVRTPTHRPGPAPGPYDPDRLTCLPGWYMLVVVTTSGIPSPATWVRVQ